MTLRLEEASTATTCSSPSIVIAHTVPKAPTRQERAIFETIAAAASRMVVTSTAAMRQLCAVYRLDRRRSMAAEARRLAPGMAWPVVADAYLSPARRLVD